MIEPRKRWPDGAVPGFTGRIDPANEPGICLSTYGDAGWGREVAETKARGERFRVDVIQAAVEAIRRRWEPNAADGWWVAAVPSHRHPGLVGAAAAQIAAALGVPCHDTISISNLTPPQKTMQNKAMQFRNIHGALDVSSPVPHGPVVLVDDIVDSGWTMTMAGWLLQTHGSGPVHPFAFAEASQRGDQ